MTSIPLRTPMLRFLLITAVLAGLLPSSSYVYAAPTHSVASPTIPAPASASSGSAAATVHTAPGTHVGLQVPLTFAQNKGRTHSSVAFQVRSMGGALFLTPNELVIALPPPLQQRPNPRSEQAPPIVAAPMAMRVVRMQYLRANPRPTISGSSVLPGTVTSFIGNQPSEWQVGVPTYAGVVYEQLYPGINLGYTGTDGQLKSTYTVAPRADPAKIRWRYTGAAQTEIDTTSGNLVVRLPTAPGRTDSTIAGTLLEQAPIAWQDIAGKRIPVTVRYTLDQGQTIGFAVGQYDPAFPLVIDPVLTYSTYLGGHGHDYGYGVAVDDAGSIYLTGKTYSADFPGTGAQTTAGDADVFVAKLMPDGKSLVYSTYLGGPQHDYGWEIAVDAEGNAYVAGTTASSTFPTVQAAQPTFGGAEDGFIAKLNPTGSNLIYSTFLGGGGWEYPWGLALDAQRNVYLAGQTYNVTNFPSANPLQTPIRPWVNTAFITKLTTAGSAFAYSTLLGGSTGGGTAYDIAVDSNGNASVIGGTTSTTFPVVNSFQMANGGGNDAFIATLNATGTGLLFSSYLGSAGTDSGTGIALDVQGQIYLTGNTTSSTFPTANPLQPALAGNQDAFVVKLPASGGSPLFSTYLGGEGKDSAQDIAVDAERNVYLTGYTRSATFPVSQAIQPTIGGLDDAFVSSIAATGNALRYSTFLGGSQYDYAFGIHSTASGNVTIIGNTTSTDLTLLDPIQMTHTDAGASYDLLVARVDPTPMRPPIPLTQPALPGSARAALLEAISIVKATVYAGPPASNATCTTASILRTLRSAVDGTFASDNFLNDDQAYDFMGSAANCLRAIKNDTQTDAATKSAATSALEKIALAGRLIPAKTLDATSFFGTTIPAPISSTIQLARQEIANGDTNVTNALLVEALTPYRAAWLHAKSATDSLWTAFDPDKDRLLDSHEAILGTSTTSRDTDGDGITDGDELTLTGTDPLVNDGSTDRDSDGLTAFQEIQAGTNALRADTDGDSLNDRVELREFGSDPRKQDTDADDLTDDTERRLGTNPRTPDTDNDGIQDGRETYTSTAATASGDVAVAMTGIGDVAGSVQFQSLISGTLFQQLPGQMSPAIDITSDTAFSNARVKIRFDPAKVPNGDTANLRILYYDEQAHVFKPTDGAYGIDTAAGYVWADSSHFTTFALFYIPNWNQVWTYTMEPGRDSTDPIVKNLDVMLVLDSSGSMQWNDPQDLRKTAAKTFVDALLPGDWAGVVDFDDWASLLQGLTTNRVAVKAAVDQIDSAGGTNIGAGVVLANQEMLANGDQNHLKAHILLTDGDGDYNPALTQQAIDNDIQIYTIGLGSSVNVALLQGIADATDGQYFQVAQASDLPNVFRRIAEGPNPTLDTDGDTLPDWLETQGIRRGNGTLITTNPTLFDTDDDGLSDAEEVGVRKTGPHGDYYDGITNPNSADTDGDGLSDSVELELGTDPTNADTDGDRLSDGAEMAAGFEPTDANPDGDSFGDAEEFQRESNPFAYDLEGWEYAASVVAGFVLGEGGQGAVGLGLLNPAYLQCFGYIGGWLASGFFAIGDIRDTLVSLVQGNVADTFLNAVGLIPLLGDGSKVVRVAAKYLNWLPNVRFALTTWIRKQFAAAPQLLDDVLAALVRQCRANSFSADTLVSTKDGLRSISTITAGDQVFGYHESTGTTGVFTITAVVRHLDSVQLHLRIGDEHVETTPEHPFFTQERGWVDAGDLWNGAHIRQASGSYGIVQHLWVEYEPQVMYNLTVAKAHTFFVGTRQWLVHNADFCEIFPNQLANRLNDELRLALRLGVKPIKGIGPDFEAAVNEGTIKWAVTEIGELVIIPKVVAGQEIAHSVLTNGKPVLAAGEADIAGAGGQFTGIFINNFSGHYRPSAESLDIGKDAFRQLGIFFN